MSENVISSSKNEHKKNEVKPNDENNYFVIEPCTSSNGIEVKLKNKKFDLAKCAEILTSNPDSQFEILSEMKVVILAKSKNYSISIYESGRMMIKEIKKTKKNEAKVFGKGLIEKLKLAII